MVGASRVLPVDESAAGDAARDGGGTPAEPSRPDRTAFADGAIGFAVAALGLSALAWAFWSRWVGAVLGLVVAAALFVGLALAAFSS